MYSTIKSSEFRQQMMGEEESTQGLYVTDASGRCLGWINESDPEAVGTFLDDCLKTYSTNKTSTQETSARLPRDSDEQTPDNVSVIKVFSRIRPNPPASGAFNKLVGIDYMWIFPADLQAISGALRSNTKGQAVAMPANFVSRLVRYHLRDNIRGEPEVWDGADVERCSFMCKDATVYQHKLRCSFEGTFRMSARQVPAHTLTGHIDGMMEFDTISWKVTNFKAFAEGQASGHCRYTPGEPAGKFPLLFAFVQCTDRTARVVKPHVVEQGYSYLIPE